NTDPATEDYASNEAEMQKRWTKSLKYWALIKYVDLKDDQAKKKADSPSMKTKTDEELETAAREDVKKMYGRIFKRFNKVKSDERFTTYVNALVEVQDPHTSYLPPVDKKNFDENMSGSFFGIGAQLRENPDDGRIIITAIVTGSPSWKQGELKADDEIQKVAQGDKTPVSVVGMELNDVVKMIRGDKGTEVRLTVKKTDGTTKVIPIIRGVVSLEETFAKSAIINSKAGKIGYIYLPEFYADFNHTSGRRCATDILKEVKKLKAEGVIGIVMDVRSNPGGSLQDVVDMTGLFTGRGPVVQVKDNEGKVSVLESRLTDTPYFSGPMAIMVNQGSASASEILAAALQDYNRAAVVGVPTFGKGTVQKMVPLDELLNPMERMHLAADTSSEPSIGSLKLTMEKFYRVSGGSTQLKGVVPDINLPDPSDYLEDDEIGERRSKSALQYDEIAKANYNRSNAITNMPQLIAASQKRVASSTVFKLINETNTLRKHLADNKIVSLNEKQYRKQQEELKQVNKRLDSLLKKAELLTLNNPAEDLEKVNLDSASIAKNKEWLKNLSKDIYIGETVNILTDLYYCKK
ncbi:MAG: tail-specific protease, partial [Chitinophagia bacterium]|nr:tail-specific protease [Chitinophagia bacterium]